MADNKDDLPALGKPTIPMSANIFSLSQTYISSPFSPGFAFLGACSIEFLKCVLPNPPFPPFKK